MRTHTFKGEFATGWLRDELVAAGVPEEWDENGDRYALVVQQEEDLAIAYEEPELDDDLGLVLEKGVPVTKLVWRRPSGEEITPPKKLIPDDAGAGTHLQLGEGHVLIQVPDNITDAAIAKVLDAHDPTPPPPPPTLEERIDELERQLATKGEAK